MAAYGVLFFLRAYIFLLPLLHSCCSLLMSYGLFIMRATEGASVFIYTSYLINDRSMKEKLFSCHKLLKTRKEQEITWPRTRQGELGRSEVNQDPSLQCLRGQFPQQAATSQYNGKIYSCTQVFGLCVHMSTKSVQEPGKDRRAYWVPCNWS